ncbi:MAG: radical SAM protein [Candidatus Promineifilaceae bacterium]|nr:radical SAM protein [Candidatus Promineifilaceae bacterium]
MFYNKDMDALQKLKLFSEEMDLEPAEEVGVGSGKKRIPLQMARQPSPPQNGGGGENGSDDAFPCGIPKRRNNKIEAPGVFHAKMPGGKTIPLLKTLLTSACERNCYYCPFRAGRNYRRATFKPEEMANTFMDMHRADMVEGLFLSSGIIKGGASTQDKILDTADILRNELGFGGYVHLKIMPGAERDQVERAMQLANRLSVNLEAPNTRRLQRLAPMKQFFEELLRPLQWVEEIRREQSPHLGWNGRWPSTVTQFVVGAVGESDLELLTTAEYLYKQLRLSRTYFSAFRPIVDTPLEEHAPADPRREHRLYQASFLLRDYEFEMEEMPFNLDGNLPLDVDPKLGWAQKNLREDPVEVNRADRESLLRVPGIGPKGAAAILTARRRGRLRELHHLRQIGVVTSRLAPFVLLDGHRPPQQLRLL